MAAHSAILTKPDGRTNVTWRMRTCGLALVAVLCLAAQASGAASGRVTPAKAMRICAAAGPFWPTETLAPNGRTAWIACKEQSRLVALDLATGGRVATVRLGAPVTAVATGGGWVWALDGESTLYRVDARRSRVTKRIGLPAIAAYNIWYGGGSVWVADDQGGKVFRVSPATGKVVARIGVGNGPADMAFGAGRAWVIDHRDRTLFRINLATNRPTRLATVGEGDAAPERLVLLAGSLWVTGRGVPVLQVDPDTGATQRTIDVDGTGIDVVAAAGDLWVPVRTAAVDRTGFPTMTALRRVTTGGSVTTAATASGRVDIHGLAAGRGYVWLADNTGGYLYRIAT
jgi:streptogramin lyase